ncbi:cadherin domain-containing protein, partial [Limnohabitans sp. 2KL-17]|uniref:cadherin domain-containing protein n=1 Tax=Limnohabitans sp. 2KL-17 TaxID=1100704 RepID=UPI001304B245
MTSNVTIGAPTLVSGNKYKVNVSGAAITSGTGVLSLSLANNYSLSDVAGNNSKTLLSNGTFDTNITGWLIGKSGAKTDANVDWAESTARFGYPSANGGTLSQTMTTVAQESYTVTYMIRTTYPTTGASTLVASAVASDGTTALASLTSSIQDSNWRYQSFTFVATGTSTTIKFDNSVDPSVNDLYLDNVVVTKGTSYLLDNTAPVFGSLATANVNENVAAGTVVYTANASDANAGVVYSLKAGVGDAIKFTIDAATGQVKLQEVPNYEGQISYAFTVVATDKAGNSADQAVVLSVVDFNDNAPVFSSGASDSVPENAATTLPIYTASTTDADGTAANKNVVYSLKAATGDIALLDIDSATGKVTLKNSANYEAKSSYSFTVVATNVGTSGTLSTEQAVIANVTNVNEAPTTVALRNTITSLAENTSTTNRIRVADIAVTDDALGTNTITLITGIDADKFELVGTALYLKAGVVLDYETKASYAVSVKVADSTVAGSTFVSTDYALNVTNVNEAPILIGLTNTTTSLAENTSTTTRIRVADIAVADDALGTNTITLTGTDAGNFEVVGAALYLKAGVVLDYETKASYAVSVKVADSTVVGSTFVSTDYALSVTNVNEAPTVTLAKDILVNTATIGHQLAPKSAALVSGGVDAGHVQVWASQQQGSERWYVFGQRYDANGL